MAELWQRFARSRRSRPPSGQPCRSRPPRCWGETALLCRPHLMSLLPFPQGCAAAIKARESLLPVTGRETSCSGCLLPDDFGVDGCDREATMFRFSPSLSLRRGVGTTSSSREDLGQMRGGLSGHGVRAGGGRQTTGAAGESGERRTGELGDPSLRARWAVRRRSAGPRGTEAGRPLVPWPRRDREGGRRGSLRADARVGVSLRGEGWPPWGQPTPWVTEAGWLLKGAERAVVLPLCP